MTLAIHQQGREFLVSFLHGGKRHNLGTFRSRGEAEAAHARRMTQIRLEGDVKAARSRGERSRRAPAETRPSRRREALVESEETIAPALICALVRYDPATGALSPPPAPLARPGALPVLCVAGVRLYAHRVAFCAWHGRWPRSRLVPLDGDYGNLCSANLVETRA